MTIVLDASAVGAFLLPDEDEKLGRLAKEVCGSERLHVPAIWRPEVASLLHKAHRRARIDDEQLRTAAAAADVVAAVVLVGPDLPIAELVAGSAAHGITAYDFTYLALAQLLDCALLTGDGPLRRAAVAAGVGVLLP